MWAQRSGLIFLTICLEDVKDPEIKVEPDKLYFKGVGDTEKKLYEVTVNFFKEVDPEVRRRRIRTCSNSCEKAEQTFFAFVEFSNEPD